MKKALLMFAVIISYALHAQQSKKLLINEIEVKQSITSGYGSYCVFVEVDNFDPSVKEHWNAIKRYSQKYCDRYRDRYFSLYFIDGYFDIDKYDCEIDLKDASQSSLYYSKIIAIVSLRSPDNQYTGKRVKQELKVGFKYNELCSNNQFREVCGVCYPYYKSCGD